MHTIEIEQDVFEFLRRNVQGFRETESIVLRRLLHLPSADGTGSAKVQDGPTIPPPQGGDTRTAALPTVESPLGRFVADPAFRLRNATDKFLRILGFFHKQDPPMFAKVLQLSGRRRKYFGRSREEIERSGKSTHPRCIPGSDYWVMTNADTRQKCDMLRKAMATLGYSRDDVRAADEAIF